MIIEKTPREQAEELIKVYMLILNHIIPTKKTKDCAKEACKIAIGLTGSKYWYDVLEEIEKFTHNKK